MYRLLITGLTKLATGFPARRNKFTPVPLAQTLSKRKIDASRRAELVQSIRTPIMADHIAWDSLPTAMQYAVICADAESHADELFDTGSNQVPYVPFAWIASVNETLPDQYDRSTELKSSVTIWTEESGVAKRVVNLHDAALINRHASLGSSGNFEWREFSEGRRRKGWELHSTVQQTINRAPQGSIGVDHSIKVFTPELDLAQDLVQLHQSLVPDTVDFQIL